MLWDWTYDFSSLSEKTRKSNRLQMSLQRQHFLLSYLKTLSVGPARVRTRDFPLSRSALSQLSQPGGKQTLLQVWFTSAAFVLDSESNKHCNFTRFVLWYYQRACVTLWDCRTPYSNLYDWSPGGWGEGTQQSFKRGDQESLRFCQRTALNTPLKCIARY